MTTRRTIALATVGLLLLVGTPALWRLTRPAPSLGQVPTVAGAPQATPTPWATTPAAAPPSPAWDVARRDAALAAEPVATVRPTALRIPTLGVDVTIVDVGVEPDGEMEVPADVRTAGWYRFGPVPGDVGSAVVAGHVDSRTQGLGAFHRLRELGLDETVTVVLSDGSVREFVTVARETYDKAEVPLADVFAREGPPRLALITCGGAFDAATRHYRDNVVVYAVPA